MSKRDLYEILGVDRNVDEDTIKKAFRKLALQHHPDRNPGDKQAEAKFREASEAYRILADSAQRAKYDRFGHAAFDGPGAGFEPHTERGEMSADGVVGERANLLDEARRAIPLVE